MTIEIVDFPIKHGDFPLIIDPENSLVLMETHLPTPMTARVELLIYQRV